MLRLTGESPPLAAGEVHVHQFGLDRDVAELERLQQLLSPEELLRAGRLLSRQKRERFVAGRGMLRIILGSYADADPAAICLTAGEHGKPCIAAGTTGNRLRFNLSHTGGQAIVALAADREVGVDLERVRDNLPFPDMARRFFSTREQAELLGLPAALQLSAFFRCWTRKEAYIKACGTGFTQPADGFSVSLLPGRPAALTAHNALPDEVLRWTLLDLEVVGGHCAALATEGWTPVVRYLSGVE